MSNDIVEDSHPLMTIVAAAQHPRYIEVMDAIGCESRALGPIIELAMQVNDWCVRVIHQNNDVFETSPFAPEYLVLEEMGKWIIDRLAEMLDAGEGINDIGNGSDLPITYEQALTFARQQITETTGIQFASPETTPVYKEPA